MILLGAGSSVPFGIPDMKAFVELFKKEVTSTRPELQSLLSAIEQAMNGSERLIGSKIEFDLESLMVVLQDLAKRNGEPISAPTFALTLYLVSDKGKSVETYNVENVRKTFGTKAKELLSLLQSHISTQCMRPINIGKKSLASFSFLDMLYGPLFVVLSFGNIRSSITTKWIFTTNWDLCLKQWLEYARMSFQDGVGLDTYRKPVLDVQNGWKDEPTDGSSKVVPLHGSLDLIRRTRYVSGKPYEEIHKLDDPETYFRNSSEEISKAFIIYPLEAVGYDQSVRSPYLDMLGLLKQVLRNESVVFVVGFSFRDSTIASIFDEIVRERAQLGREKDLKIVLISSSPRTIIDNLNRQGFENISRALIPIELIFPNVIDTDDLAKVRSEIRGIMVRILDAFHSADILVDLRLVRSMLAAKYQMTI